MATKRSLLERMKGHQTLAGKTSLEDEEPIVGKNNTVGVRKKVGSFVSHEFSADKQPKKPKKLGRKVTVPITPGVRHKPEDEDPKRKALLRRISARR